MSVYNASLKLSNVILQATPTTSYASTFGLFATTGDSEFSLISFNLSGLPSNLKIYAVSIIMNYSTALQTPQSNWVFYQLRRAFTTGATWNTYDGSNGWTTAGAMSTTGDIFSTVCGNLNVPSTGSATTVLPAAGITVFQNWINGSSPNNGFALEYQAATGYQTDVTNLSTIVAQISYYPLPVNRITIDMRVR
jgi:hypothetical protein